jgi:general secretion pathway protein D
VPDFGKRRVQIVHNLLRCCRALLPVMAMTLAGCSASQQGAYDNLQDPWRDRTRPRLEGPKHQQFASDRTASPTVEGEDIKTSYMLGNGRFVGEAPEAKLAAAEDVKDGVTINLVNVPIPQAAKSILSDTLAVKYTIDPGIEGRVTIQTPKPIDKSALVDLFQSALRSNNAAVIKTGESYKIVAADHAVTGSILVGGMGDPRDRLGSRVEVIQLKYVAAAEMKRILEPISPRNAVIGADSARNTVTISGTNQDIATMMDAISVFDVDVMKGMSFALVPVNTAQPQVIAEQLRNVFSSEREGPMAGMVRFVPNTQLNAVLVMSPQREYLSRAETWVRRLDARAEGSEKQFYTYPVQNRRAQEIVDVFQGMLAKEMNGGRGAPATSRTVAPQYREASLQSGNPVQAAFQALGAQGMATGANAGSGGSFFGGSFSGGSLNGGPSASPHVGSSPEPAASGAAAGAATTEQEPRIKIGLDEGKNAILINATPADYRRVMRMIGTLDVMPKQVLIEATIAEVTLTDELKFGVRWYLQNKNGNSTFTDDPSGALGAIFPSFSYAFAIKNLTATLSALNTITDVNIISSPSLTVMDNKTAMLQIGDEVPITTQSAVNTITAGAPVVNSISYKDTGIMLAMTPRINASGRILLDLEQEVSTVAATTTSGIDSPTIHKRHIRTSVVVNNGEALALGGLIQDSKTNTRTQAPILGDIPIIGNAFGQKDNQLGKTELLIIIVPHLMRNGGESRMVTDEYRRELMLNGPPRVRGPATMGQAVRRLLE